MSIIAITKHGIITSDGSLVVEKATTQVVYYQNNAGEAALIVANVGADLKDVYDILNSQTLMDVLKNGGSFAFGTLTGLAVEALTLNPVWALSASVLASKFYDNTFEDAQALGHWIGQNLPTPYEIENTVSDWYTRAQRWVFRADPLTFDLDGDGIETVPLDPNNPILFDHDADGVKTATGWIKGDDAFLVLDRNGNGTIDNGTELFGDSTPLLAGGSAADGFAALQDQDTNHDGVVNANDTNFANLRLWQDLNQDGISQAGELFTLTQKGIAAIHVSKTENSTLLPNGNVLADTGNYMKTDERVFCRPIRSLAYA